MSKEKKKIEVSPMGTIVYAWLENPQPPFKGKEGDGKYTVTLALSADDPANKKWCEAFDATTKFIGRPWKTDEESGNIFVKFKSDYPAKLVDSRNVELAAGVFPSRGSQVRVAYVPNEYPGFGGGINLYLHGVQVLEFREYHKEINFPVEEKGYVAQSEEEDKRDEADKGDDNGPF